MISWIRKIQKERARRKEEKERKLFEYGIALIDQLIEECSKETIHDTE